MDIHDTDILNDIECFREFLWDRLHTEVERLGLVDSLKLDDVQLVLEPRVDDEGVLCCYYFANPAARALFWLDSWEAPGVLNSCLGVETVSHKGNLYVMTLESTLNF